MISLSSGSRDRVTTKLEVNSPRERPRWCQVRHWPASRGGHWAGRNQAVHHSSHHPSCRHCQVGQAGEGGASWRDPRRRGYVWRSCLDDGSARVIVEEQRTGELTDGGGACSGDEEDGSEKLGDEHGNVGDVSTGWLMSSKGIHPRFYVFPRVREA